MRIIEGSDLWDYSGESNIVIPTNIGWTKELKNVMGRGVAKQAAERYPDLAQWYGKQLWSMLAHMQHVDAVQIIPFLRYFDLILFPVKPLAKNPSMSWRGKAQLEMIRLSATKLNNFSQPDADGHTSMGLNYPSGLCFLPLVGCGNGRLDKEDVIPMLQEILDNRFVLVLQ